MLVAEPLGFEDCRRLWNVQDVDRLLELRAQVRAQQAKKDSSSWSLPKIPPSYLENGFCSAALTAYIEFLIEHRHSVGIVDAFLDYSGPEEDLPESLERDLSFPEGLLEGLDKKEGLDVVRQTKTRANQGAFRRIVLHLYRGRCCVTGLEIPQINRASHIIPWAEDKSKRLDPRNGLCLSATYDAAFDKHLISLDEDYRLILSRNLKDHYDGKGFHEVFVEKEGSTIELPERYRPDLSFLATHRSRGAF